MTNSILIRLSISCINEKNMRFNNNNNNNNGLLLERSEWADVLH
jgi:hypothetical protein